MTSALRIAIVCSLAVGCTDDPIYVEPMAAIEVGADGQPGTASASVMLPIRLETTEEAEERATLAAEIGAEVPFVTRDDLDISVEWSIKNVSDADGVALIHMNGANEWFAYVPTAFVVDVEDEEVPPPLGGNIPMEIAAGDQRSGVFREDELAEASLDLELITRGGLTPFAAVLEVHEDMDEIDAAGVPVPSDAFASMIRFDMTLIADRHMVLEYTIRVRDHRSPGLLHEELAAAPAEELTAFAPADFAPAGPAALPAPSAQP
jgi:hypothetical protein